ncbi:MAG: serine/threonine protein kinase [Deltaproteobacteria bacterium]|nr:serine/threonine protein kinase [Deltaproteobacteria bacterium]
MDQGKGKGVLLRPVVPSIDHEPTLVDRTDVVHRGSDTLDATIPRPRVELEAEAASAVGPTGPVGKLDRFGLGDILGRGGMGEVVSAGDDAIGRKVAIKRLRAETPAPHQVTRFLREARIQGRLQHPAVVPVHELHDDPARPYFVMKQLTGVTLGQVVKKLAAGDAETQRLFPRQRLLRALAEVCLAVEFAHTRGVVHRDLKPANIVLGDFGEVYVLDWGIAHVMRERAAGGFADIETYDDKLVTDGMVLGSPGYMSPEQIRVDPSLDGRSDVYALGCLLFEVLALEPLHESGIAGIALALTGAEARFSRRVPDREVPPELEVICVRATQTDREHRYATARELGDAVQAFLDGDRDVALRKQLALVELAKARAALERDDRPADRRIAIRAAARALALDPANGEPADLVGRLMLEPPREVPAEVDEAVARVDDDAMFNARKLIVQAAIAYLAFFPIIYIIGFRNAGFLATGAGIAALMGILAARATRDHVRLIGLTGLVGNCLMTVLFAWAVTPFLVAPSLGVITAMSLSTHPRLAKGWVIAAAVSASILLPVLLEAAGALPASTLVDDGLLILRTTATSLDRQTTTVALVLYVIAIVAMSVILGKSLTNDRRAAQRLVQIQTWQLRQLVPQLSPGGSETIAAVRA